MPAKTIPLRKSVSNEVVAYSPEMEPEVISLLEQGFNNRNISKEGWRNALNYPWRNSVDPVGFALVVADRIQGFLFTIFSRRNIGGVDYRLCNLSAWFVRPEYRIRAGYLFLRALEEKGCHFTGLTPKLELQPTFRKMGFKTLESHYLALNPTSFLLVPRQLGVQYIDDPKVLSAMLPPEGKKLIEDHSPFPCQNLILKKGESTCHIIYNLKRSEQFTYAHIHYASDGELLQKYSRGLFFYLFRKQKVRRLLIDRRQISQPALFGGREIEFTSPRVILSPSSTPDFALKLLDNLYTELVMLGV